MDENNNKKMRRNEMGLFEPLFNSFFDYPTISEGHGMMRTDIRESETGYEFSVEVPGIQKKDVNLELEDGYLNITASRKHEEDENDHKGRLIRQERFYGSYKRSYYIGDNIKQSDITATMNDGLLIIDIKKPVKEESKKMIEIL